VFVPLLAQQQRQKGIAIFLQTGKIGRFTVKTVLSILSFLLLINRPLVAQHSNNYVDATIGVGSYQGSLAISYTHYWRFGGNGKMGIGLGGRITSYFGANQYYVTAPAELTSGSSSPLIIFKNNISANIDTFLVKSPQVTAINASVNIDYRITNRLIAGFNIDAIGFSFGSYKTGNYINGFTGRNTGASPTQFNILLISDNDRGSLNSEFYAKYFINGTWGIKLGAQFLFTEYTTKAKVQQFPRENDRFRNKSLMVCLGISHKL